MLDLKDFGRRTHKRAYERSDSDAVNIPGNAKSIKAQITKEALKGKWLSVLDVFLLTWATSAERRFRELREEWEANGIAVEEKVVTKNSKRYSMWRVTDTQALRAHINNESK